MLSIFNSLLFPNFAQISWGCSSLSGNIRRWIWSKSKWKSQNPSLLQLFHVMRRKIMQERRQTLLQVHPSEEGGGSRHCDGDPPPSGGRVLGAHSWPSPRWKCCHRCAESLSLSCFMMQIWIWSQFCPSQRSQRSMRNTSSKPLRGWTTYLPSIFSR